MTTTPIHDDDRAYLSDLEALLGANQMLEKFDRPLLAAPCGAVETAIEKWLEDTARRASDPDFLAKVLQKLPGLWLDRIATTTADPRDAIRADHWQKALRGYAPGATALPRFIFDLDDAGIERIIDLGFSLDTLLPADTAATLWMTRGARFAETAFRARFPRKSPVIEYWCSGSRNLYPRAGLHPDGVSEMAQEIRRQSGRQLPEKIATNRNAILGKSDWRIAFALLAHDVTLPFQLQRHLNLNSVLGPDIGPRAKALFGPSASGHHALSQSAARKALPDLETLLALPPDTDVSFLDAFLPKVPV